jgi:hypothetical protein
MGKEPMTLITKLFKWIIIRLRLDTARLTTTSKAQRRWRWRVSWPVYASPTRGSPTTPLCSRAQEKYVPCSLLFHKHLKVVGRGVHWFLDLVGNADQTVILRLLTGD